MRAFACFALVGAALLASAAPAFAASTVYRLTDLDLRDPHVFMDVLGCRDFTDNPFFGFSFNGDFQTSIQADSSGDGLLDLSLLVVFDPLDVAGPGGPMRFGESSCTAPMAGTTCGPVPYENLLALVATNSEAGECLAPTIGTTHGYSPAITSATGPCFASSEAPVFLLPIFDGSVPLILRHVRVGARYSGDPVGSLLANGLLMGFLTEADANNTIIPASVALVGSQPLSVLFPGGDPPGTSACCAGFSDLDTGPAGEPGWWMYFNFIAEPVSYSGPSVDVGPAGGARLALAPANPSRGTVSMTYELETDGPVSITVHDLSGRRIAAPISGWHTAGAHRAVWDGRLDGRAAAAGLYVIRLAGPSGSIARKVVLLR